MSYFFCLHAGHLGPEADAIARRHGAAHTNFTEPSGERRGWFAGPNRGEPFDRDLAARVLADLEAAGGLEALRLPRPLGW